MKNKLEELRKNMLIEVSSWGGLSLTPGTSGLIVTQDKKVYYYHMYFRVPEKLKDKISLEDISEGKELQGSTYKKLIKYIEEKIINVEYENKFIFDASFHIIVNYKNKKITVNNYPEINNEINRIIRGGE